MATSKGRAGEAGPTKRTHVSQGDVPRHTLDDALRVARAISDNYAKQPTKPLRVAEALGVAPTTGTFRTLTAASVAYGLTEGTAWAEEISLTDLGRRIVAPTKEGDDVHAMREALLRPRMVGEFLRRYNNSKFPAERIAYNVLEEMGMPADATKRTLDLIVSGSKALGLIREINGQQYVDLQGAANISTAPARPPDTSGQLESLPAKPADSPVPATTPTSLRDRRRVFVTHGSNLAIVQQLKELLTFGDLEPVVSVEKSTAAKPVPDKVMDDMRSCGAGIVHVGSEMKLMLSLIHI